MILSFLKNRLSLFWILQLTGWAGYALDRWILSPRFFFPVSFTYILIAFGLSLCLRPIYRRVWAARPSLLKVGIVSLMGSIAAGFFWLLVSQFIFWLFDFGPYPRDVAWPGYLAETFIYTLSHHKPFLFLSWSAVYFGIKYWQGLGQQQECALRAEALARQSELQMLRYQLNPHFIFNSLNSAGALIREDPRRAEKMLGELSEFLRYSLAHAKTAEVTLRDEMEAVRNYLAIEKIRFEDKLAVSFHISAAAEEFRVPSLLIYPLVENAVKYGMATSPLPLTISVAAQATDGHLRLEVINTGKWVQPSQNGASPAGRGTGIGLQNVRQRLQQMFPERHRFDIFERDERVHAVLEIERQKS
jgi:histidine kinase/histidine kinase/DNA gyrase B/HSP90-like ATPase